MSPIPCRCTLENHCRVRAWRGCRRKRPDPHRCTRSSRPYCSRSLRSLACESVESDSASIRLHVDVSDSGHCGEVPIRTPRDAVRRVKIATITCRERSAILIKREVMNIGMAARNARPRRSVVPCGQLPLAAYRNYLGIDRTDRYRDVAPSGSQQRGAIHHTAHRRRAHELRGSPSRLSLGEFPDSLNGLCIGAGHVVQASIGTGGKRRAARWLWRLEDHVETPVNNPDVALSQINAAADDG